MINEQMYSLGSKRSVIREIFEYSKKRAAEVGKDKVYDFSIGNPSVEPPPEVNAAIVDLAQNECPVDLHGYTSAQGAQSTRAAIATDINNRFGTHLGADNIYMSCGAAASLAITLRALCNEGDECIVFAPFFTEYRVFITNAGARVVVSMPEEKSFNIDLADLESKITPRTKAVIVNSLNNPSGVVYPEETVIALAELLTRKSKEYSSPIYLIADEPYRELVYGDVKVPYLMNYYRDTVVCYSYSKALSLPGERIGYIAVSPDMQDSEKVYLAVCGAGRSLGYVCAPSLFQRVIERTIGASVDVSRYKENRDLIYDALTSYGYECVRPDGAFYLFVKALEPDAYAFYERAKSMDLLVVPCDDFGTPGYIRIAYCVPKERIENALLAFKKLAESYSL